MSTGCLALASGVSCSTGLLVGFLAGHRRARSRFESSGWMDASDEEEDENEMDDEVREKPSVLSVTSAAVTQQSRASSSRLRDNGIFRRSSSATYAKNEMSSTDEKVVIAMVGLPARGKSFIAKAIIRYLTFLGCQVRIFNAGNLRRDTGKAGIGAAFFDSKNEDAKKLRENLAMQCLDQLLEFVTGTRGCVSVGILDATNTTLDRRKHVYERVAVERGVCLFFLESLCTDEDVLQENYRLKLANEDYKGTDAVQAQSDFMARVKQYESVYQPVEDVEDGVARSYIKIYDAGRKISKCRGETEKEGQMVPRMVFELLSSLHLGFRSIFLMVVAPSENDVKGLMGGDTSLSPLGRERGHELAQYIQNYETEQGVNSLVLCGTSRRHNEMAAFLNRGNRRILKLQRMNEMCVGSFDNMSLSDVEKLYPEEAGSRRKDKLNYRYPGEGGESYQDLIARMHEHILRLEQYHGCIVVLCDKRVCRVLLAYFRGTPLKEMPYTEVPAELVELERSHSGFEERLHPMPWRGHVHGIHSQLNGEE
mmetsp:Transcript_92133/g.192631  ORF Transcript_92133/g.192631 Transcript_92133/m.192631 type:complete len:537 (-) Transcript_92133:289-1899(-)